MECCFGLDDFLDENEEKYTIDDERRGEPTRSLYNIVGHGTGHEPRADIAEHQQRCPQHKDSVPPRLALLWKCEIAEAEPQGEDGADQLNSLSPLEVLGRAHKAEQSHDHNARHELKCQELGKFQRD